MNEIKQDGTAILYHDNQHNDETTGANRIEGPSDRV